MNKTPVAPATKTINGNKIVFRDMIKHTVQAKFTMWQRIKILFGKPVYINSSIYLKERGTVVVASEASNHVPPLFRSKKAKQQIIDQLKKSQDAL